METFLDQIKEDIEYIRENNISRDPLLAKDEYAFNYWILDKLYSIDEELIPYRVVEYNDKNVDCFAHFEESKELFIIQNKYYSQNTAVNRKEVSDFLKTPIAVLKSGKYKRNKELQQVFSEAIEDPEYKIWLHFYVTNNSVNDDVRILINGFNNEPISENEAQIRIKYSNLNSIYSLYYGESYKEKVKFKFKLKTKNKGTILQILPEQYNLEGMSEAYYIMTPIEQLYSMYKNAIKSGYPIFEENIREYLGRGGVNGGIIRTLKDPSDRKNFFYYNNGVTIICEKTDKTSGQGYSVELSQPQIVNGCQTVNSIFEVLSNYTNQKISQEYKDVYVMVKILIFNDEIKKTKPNFYKDIVKFTNRQNSINDKAFGASKSLFTNLQKYFRERGFLLEVKPSDKYQNRVEFKDKIKLNELLFKANSFTSKSGIKFESLADISVPLDKLLQLFVSIMIDGSVAYDKKSQLLKPNSELFNNYSLKIQESLKVDSMIQLYVLFKIADKDRKKSQDLKTPVPYYLVGFIGEFMSEKSPEIINEALNKLLNTSPEYFNNAYNYFKRLTNLYKKKFDGEYNKMIKSPINKPLLRSQIDTLETIGLDNDIEDFLGILQKETKVPNKA